jgi:CRISPR-associated protein Csm3
MSEQSNVSRKPLFGKVILEGKIKCLTGMHIGTSRESLEIGGLDSPVLRDPATKLPYIPGSSLKGKMRSILERLKDKPFNRNAAQILQHVCDNEKDAYVCPVCRLFGSTGKGERGNFPARLSVRDCEFFGDHDKFVSEVKFENSLDRITAAANPRQIERVTAGAEFSMELVYDVETQSVNGKTDCSLGYLKDDLGNILTLLNLIEHDSIGGHGSRGYGKVEFKIEKFMGYTILYYGPSEDKNQYKCGIEFDAVQLGKIDDCRTKIEDIANLFIREAVKCSGS